MSYGLYVILVASLAVLVGDLVYRLLTSEAAQRRLQSVLAVALSICALMLAAPFAIETRESSDGKAFQEAVSVVLCYLSMLFGMMAEYGYAQAEAGRKKFKFELMPFLMPVFASPIVFIPLLTITTDVAAGGAFTRAKLMVYLVAFQSGFFWKSFFEQRRQDLARAHT